MRERKKEKGGVVVFTLHWEQKRESLLSQNKNSKQRERKKDTVQNISFFQEVKKNQIEEGVLLRLKKN